MKKIIILIACALFYSILTQAQTTGKGSIYIIDGEKISNFDGSQLKGKTVTEYRIVKAKKNNTQTTVHIIDTSDSLLPDSLRQKGKIVRIYSSKNIFPKDSADLTGLTGSKGKTSMNKPLVFVDGKEFGGNMSDLKPSDIKAIQVYKAGSDEAKRYGDKGNNGVMKITTNKMADNVFYYVNGKRIEEDEFKKISVDKIKSIKVLKHGSNKAIEFGGEDGETHDYFIVELQ